MAEPTLNLSEFLSAREPNEAAPRFESACALDLFLAIPVIWTPGMQDCEWQEAVGAMLRRSAATSAFVSGHLSPADFSEVLFETGVEPGVAAEVWEDGDTL
jgi:hypothetical protein